MKIKTYEEIKEITKDYKIRSSFASYARDTQLLKEESYFIKLKDFFHDGLDFLSRDEIESLDLENDYFLKEIYNTYNQNGPIERNLQMAEYQSLESDEVVVLYSIHTGLDARAGYVGPFAVRYFDNYEFLEHIALERPIIEIQATDEEDNHYLISINAAPASEMFLIDIRSDVFNDYIESWDIDLYDESYLKESVKELVKDEAGTKIAIKKINNHGWSAG